MTGNSTENLWYIARDGQQHGPISETEMQLFVKNGHLRPTDLLWRPGFAEWQPATTVFPDQLALAPEAAPRTPEAPIEPAPAKQETGGAQAKATGEASRGGEEKPAAAAAAANARSAIATSRPADARPAQPVQAVSPAPAREQAPKAQGLARPGPGEQSAVAGPRPRDPGPENSKAAARSAAPSGVSRAPAAVPQEPVAARFEDAPKAAGRGRKLVLATVLLAIIGGSFAYLISHKDNIAAMMGVGEQGGDVPVVKAEPPSQMKAQQETAALQSPTQPEPPAATRDPEEAARSAPTDSAPADQTAATQSTMTPTATPPSDDNSSAVDTYYQQSKLWQYMKRAYPDWYGERISAAAALGNGAMPPRDATKSLVEGLVALRRQHADEALQADTGMLKAIASAFLSNLQSLAEKGPDTCYGFISQGETSPKSVDLFHKPQSAPELEAQALTIFEAIAAGKAAPTQHERPKKGDYDVLAAELGKLGWSQADLQLFADPKALSSAPHARVCTMVRDWFKAHIAISDAAVQERLLFETLRPVVSG